jgi:hypothetical protein
MGSIPVFVTCSLRRPRRRIYQLTAAGDSGLSLDVFFYLPQCAAGLEKKLIGFCAKISSRQDMDFGETAFL